MNRVAIIAGCRTPFVKAGGALARYNFLDLGIHVVKSCIERSGVDPKRIEELVFSTVLLDPRLPNAARELVLRSGLPKTLSAHFVSNNCISGLVAVNFVADAIKTGRISCALAGGSESMSQPTLTLRKQSELFFIRLAGARSLGERLKILSGFRPGFLMPLPPSPKEPSSGLTMGQHCELSAKEFSIARKDQDEWALKSHQSAARAQAAGFLAEEIAPLEKAQLDNLVRKDTTLERLNGLKPVFDRGPSGSLTAGNSSALTDGASAVILMSESAARQSGHEILGYIEAVEFSAIDPADGLLMAPALALPRLLTKSNLKVSDIDYFEIHEAFAAQVLANMQLWERGWSKYPDFQPIGKISFDRVNVNGGSLAIGHPFAATGGRLIMSLVNQLQRSGNSTGVISVCAAGAMAAAVLVRRD